MAGLILLAALAVLIALLVFLSRLATQSLAISAKAKTALRWLIVVGAFPLMVADEVVGMYQFNALCKANGIESADVSKARGRRVKLEVDARSPLKGMIMPGTVEDWFYKDAVSNEIVIHHKDYYAFGGWLMRYTPLSMGSHHPMLFSGGCIDDYVARDAIFSQNNISLVN